VALGTYPRVALSFGAVCCCHSLCTTLYIPSVVFYLQKMNMGV
jgi:hypothetical protein